VLEPADMLALHQVLSAYSHIVDGRAWDRLDEVFEADVVFDATAHGGGTSVGLPALRERWQDNPPARLHHHTDVVVSQDADGTVRVLSKSIGVHADGTATAGRYLDVARMTEAGWRISHRIAEPLTALPNPNPEPRP
jgi:SnoaL-like protein